MIAIKTPDEIGIMRKNGRLLAEIVKKVAEKIRPGVTTQYLNKAAEGLILEYGAKPNFKGYQGFPAAFCTCVNEEVVHCVPSKRELKEGDIITLDGGLVLNGFHSDMAITVPVLNYSSELGANRTEENISPDIQRLIKVTKKALEKGIRKVKPGNTFGDIGNAIQEYVESNGFSIIRDLGGHGIGRELHEEPQILNYGKKGQGQRMKEGMVFCLEPIVSAGDWRIKTAKDGYGYQTRDGSLSAHFEHMVAVTKTGYEVLTS